MRKGKKRLLGLVFCFLLAMSTLAYGAQTPSVSAQTAILTEASTGKILFEKDAEAKIYPASMTKVLTALVAVEYFEPDDVIVVGREINEVSLDSSKAGHVVGESITFRNLVRGLMIPSGNDSAEVVACAVARKAQKRFAQCGRMPDGVCRFDEPKSRGIGLHRVSFCQRPWVS